MSVTAPTARDNKRWTYGVPASERGEAVGAASGVAARRDVVQCSGALGVEERVEETKRALSLVQERIVEERDDAGERWAGCARSVDTLELASDLDGELHALGGHVGERAALGVEEALVGVPELLEVARDGVGLVVGLREDVGEPARGEVRGRLGADTLRASNGRQAVRGQCR